MEANSRLDIRKLQPRTRPWAAASSADCLSSPWLLPVAARQENAVRPRLSSRYPGAAEAEYGAAADVVRAARHAPPEAGQEQRRASAWGEPPRAAPRSRRQHRRRSRRRIARHSRAVWPALARSETR